MKMADEQADPQRPSFNWPPTAEELDQIQVIEMPPPPGRLTRRPWWQRSLSESVMTQAAVLAGSLAAIGIALTSLLAPAQAPIHPNRSATRARTTVAASVRPSDNAS